MFIKIHTLTENKITTSYIFSTYSKLNEQIIELVTVDGYI